MLSYIPGDSFLHKLDPRNKLAIAVFFLVVAFMFKTILPLAISLGVVMLLWLIAKAPAKTMRTMLIIISGFGIFIILVQGIFYAGETKELLDVIPNAWRTGWIANTFGVAGDPGRGLALSKEGVVFGVALTLRLGIIICTMPLITLITPIKDLALAVERLGASWQVSFLVLSTFRFLPLLVEQTQTILNAQKLRGLDVEKAGLIRKITSYAPLAIPVILGAYRNSQQLEFVLECRGFSTSKERTSLYDIVWRRSDTVFAILLIIVFVLLLLLRLNVVQRLL